MVRDGYYYGAGLFGAAVLIGWLASPCGAIVPMLLAGFFLCFFRDPERAIPTDPGVVVSPADGKETQVKKVDINRKPMLRISIFLNDFAVHVNRSPMAGGIRAAHYQTGKFLSDLHPACVEFNE